MQHRSVALVSARPKIRSHTATSSDKPCFTVSEFNSDSHAQCLHMQDMGQSSHVLYILGVVTFWDEAGVQVRHRSQQRTGGNSLECWSLVH